MANCGGLRSSCNDQVPLKGIEVEVEVRDHVATVSSVLQYENQEESPIEAVFVFPLPGDAAVCHFSAKIGQSEVVAVVKEKQRARDEYNHVLSSGQQAFLLEESEQSPDVFSLSLGSLPPGESACIRLQYVTELALEADGGLRFCLPAVLNPRYQPQGRWEGHRPPVVTSVPAFLVPYSLSLSARLSSPRPVTKVESNCSLEPLRYLNTEQTNATVRLAAGHRFDRDVELLIYYKDAHWPTAVVEAGRESVEAGSLMGDPVVMLSLYPEFPKAVMSSVTTCGEFLFLMDRSGSMRDHTRIESARDTLLLILKSLPMGCYFNIYGFGTHFNHIFPKSVEYKQDTMEETLKKVEKMKADMGGTQILPPLRHIYEQSCIPGHPRQLFVFTDGEVKNTKDVIELVKKNASSHRCFTFGIGEGASSALINGMSKQGGGHAQFITGTERMQPKVMQSLDFALQPVVVDISLEWNLPVGVSVTPLSPPITSLFRGQRSLLYAQLTGESSSASDGSVKVRYRLADQPFECQLRFSLKPAKGESELTVHRLGARTLIRSLEQIGERGQVDEVKKKVVELSIESGVSSAFTAFIAVNRGNWEMVQGPLLRRNVPVPGRHAAPRRGGFSFGATQSELNGPSGTFTLGSKTPGQPETPGQPAGSTLSSLFSFSFESTPFGAKRHGHHGHHGHPAGSSLFCLRTPESPFGGGGQTGGSLFRGQPGAAQNMELDMGMEIDRPSGNMTIGSSEEGRGGFEKAHSYPSPRVKLLWLIGLQRACGSWIETPTLEDVLDKSEYQIENSRPAQVDDEVWTTVLALIWLYGTKFEAQEEWQPLATKAIAWLHAQNGSKPLECFAAGLDFLELRRLKDAKGLCQLAIRLCV